ncbi:MAG: type II secretion system protein [Leptolyngbya sp. PLA1]|nr:type II secretion system protein [Leptolyngbya sp. PLA1]
MGRTRGKHNQAGTRAFSLVEVAVTLGVLMVLVSFILPTIRGARDAAGLTRDSASLKQCAALVAMYAAVSNDRYPVGGNNPIAHADSWYRPLIAAGLAAGPAEIDAVGVRRRGGVRFWQSSCMNLPPDRMLPGRTLPAWTGTAEAQRVTDVLYPSAKGHLFRATNGEGTASEGGQWFCCGPRWRSAVAMGDASVTRGDYIDFNGGEPPVIVDDIGRPVYTTWGGIRGRDR